MHMEDSVILTFEYSSGNINKSAGDWTAALSNCLLKETMTTDS